MLLTTLCITLQVVPQPQSDEAFTARCTALGAAASFLPAPDFDKLVSTLLTVRLCRVRVEQVPHIG